jgi:uncharacterized protein (TIGR03067 family)
MNDAKRALQEVAEILRQEGWQKPQAQVESFGTSRPVGEPEKLNRESIPIAWLAGSAATLAVLGFLLGGYFYAAAPGAVQETRFAALEAETKTVHEKVSGQETRLIALQQETRSLGVKLERLAKELEETQQKRDDFLLQKWISLKDEFKASQLEVARLERAIRAKALLGVWIVTSAERRDKAVSTKEVVAADVKFTFKPNKVFTVESKLNACVAGKYEIVEANAPTKLETKFPAEPASLPFLSFRGSNNAIFEEVDLDTLRMCIATEPEAWPTSFNLDNQPKCVLVQMKRLK